MRTETNKFGSGNIHEAKDLIGPIYAHGCACMAIQSEALSFANAHPYMFTKDPSEALSIVVLSCQVTDLAILNDIRTVELLQRDYPSAKVYVGGCLAKRFDIELPAGARRLETLRSDYTHIQDSKLVNFEAPFWAPDFAENDDDLATGHIFRNMYPLRIGVGCEGKCTYCTIRITRGAYYELSTDQLVPEFLAHENVVLIADCPTAKQIEEWSRVAIQHNKPLSIRNLEPQIYTQVAHWLKVLAELKLLKILHIPVQSVDEAVLHDMGRSVKATKQVLDDARFFQKHGVITATNIIIDYKGMTGNERSVPGFDYVSWNPLWDGKWDRTSAEERFERYIGG